MKNILIGILVVLVLILTVQFCRGKKEDQQMLVADTALIQKELKNVGKLIVTEGQYAQVFNYSASRDLLYGLTTASKKALVVVNAKATIGYDLSKIETRIDEGSKTVYITKIPEPELNIYPEIEYYDVKQDYLNQFQASDHNAIKRKVTELLKKKIEASELRTNAENRLISELQKIYILTNSLGWTLQYNQTVVEKEEDFQNLKL
ncbi:MAG TPA: DUF4230 domain-containing protein [Flavobacteriaceae bacterium]|nr:DUF4230 domain-containing protein [Flavobacteriaceae bacterium]